VNARCVDDEIIINSQIIILNNENNYSIGESIKYA
jgi:hypothetical protein